MMGMGESVVGAMLFPKSRDRASVDNTRRLYADLLHHIDVSNDLLGRRGIDDSDEQLRQKSLRNIFSRSLLSKFQTAAAAALNTDADGIGSSASRRIEADDISSSPSAVSIRSSGPSLSSHSKSRSRSLSQPPPQSTKVEAKDLAAAFRIMAATRSADKEGRNLGAVAIRDDASVAALSTARGIETRVVRSIQRLGELVASCDRNYAKSNIRSDSVFEYFCEKNMLSLFVDIAKEVPCHQDSSIAKPFSYFHGVVWSPKVKAQIFRTTAHLIKTARNSSVLYYLLSNGSINELLSSITPMHRWTHPALEEMMPAYVDLLDNLVIRLESNPDIFPFLILSSTTSSVSDSASSSLAQPAQIMLKEQQQQKQEERRRQDGHSQNEEVQNHSGTDDQSQKPKESTQHSTASLPLFNAALDIATSNFASSDSHIYTVCINAIISIVQLPSAAIQEWVAHADFEQQRIANHLSERLNYRFTKIASLSTGPIVDSVRCNAIAGQLSTYRISIDMVNEVVWSGVSNLNVRICECFLQRVVSVMLHHLLPRKYSQFLNVGTHDVDCIPEPEALAQLATLCLSSIFSHANYAPFQRMLAVALLHPNSTSAWEDVAIKNRSSQVDAASSQYILMPALNGLIQSSNREKSSEADGSKASTGKMKNNSFKEELMKCIEGRYGGWRVASTAVLVESILKCEAIDNETLAAVDTIFNANGHAGPATPVERGIATYLCRNHQLHSPVSKTALETVGSVSARMLVRSMVCSFATRTRTTRPTVAVGTATAAGAPSMIPTEVLAQSAVWKGLCRARRYFCTQVLKCQNATGISEIFLDITESAIIDRYKMHRNHSGVCVYTAQVSRREYSNMAGIAELLVRKFRGVGTNDVEITRFYVEMALHFRAICRAMTTMAERAVSAKGNRLLDKHGKTLLVRDEADAVCRKVAGFVAKQENGTDLDLRGRMTFRFHAPRQEKDSNRMVQSKVFASDKDTIRRAKSFSEELGVFRPKNFLLLVLDPTDIYIVQPSTEQIESNRGTVVLSISLLNIIAAAADGENLHVAVKHDDVPKLIRNGNMALRFESGGSCLIVQQYLDRSRHTLRKELAKEALALFGEFAEAPPPVKQRRSERDHGPGDVDCIHEEKKEADATAVDGAIC